MRRLPDYGIYPWWPEDGEQWIHPDDVAVARSLIPGDRIFCRDGCRDGYVVLRYGELEFRVRPTLWQPIHVAADHFNVGDEVEVRSLLGQNDPGLAIIREMLWDAKQRAVRYQIEQNDMLLPKHFSRDDLRPVEFLDRD